MSETKIYKVSCQSVVHRFMAESEALEFAEKCSLNGIPTCMDESHFFIGNVTTSWHQGVQVWSAEVDVGGKIYETEWRREGTLGWLDSGIRFDFGVHVANAIGMEVLAS